MNVFVSYSHDDASLVAPVVKLLRVNETFVFQDIDGIHPGKRWRSEIERNLAASNLVVVFWCFHASRSSEVLKEWRTAIEQEKDLLPLLIDSTPLPQELKEFQWIDFQALVGATHPLEVSPSGESKLAALGPSTSPKASHWLALIGFVVLITMMAWSVMFLYWKTSNSTPSAPPKTSVPQPSASPILPTPEVRPSPDTSVAFPVSESWFRGEYLLLLAILLAIAGSLIWLMRRRSKIANQIKPTSGPSPEIVSHIAREMEVEMIRRTALKPNAGA